MNASTEDDVRDLLRLVLPAGGASAPLARDASLRAAGLDSLRTMELITALEDRFAIRLEEDDLRDEAFASVGGVVALVHAKQGTPP